MFRWFGRRHDSDNRGASKKQRGGFRLEALENRQLLSVSPMAPAPVDAVDDTSYIAADYQAIGDWSVAVEGELQVTLACHSGGSEETPADPVTAENQAPSAGDDAFSLLTDQQIGGGVMGNDADPDGDALTAVLGEGPMHGTLDLRADGRFVYRPDAGYNGSDSFTYTVTDGVAASNTATVTFEVTLLNQEPTAGDDAYSTLEGQALVVDADTGVLANDADADGDPLSAVLVDPPTAGTVVLRDDGSLEYTPQEGFSGVDSFTYVASDVQGQSAPATVSVTVEALNEAPLAADDAYTVAEDETLTVEAGGVLANDSDADGDALSAVLVDGPAGGELTLAADGSFQYTPAAGFSGTDSFTYLAGDGELDSNVATVTIEIQAVNDLPVAQDDAYGMAEDETLTVDAGGVLANDSDADGDALSAVLVDGPAGGELTLADDGSFQYTPAAGFSGTDSFTYRAVDAEGQSEIATVTITVDPVNDAPVAQDDAYEALENQPLVVEAGDGVLANDSDADADAMTAVLVAGPSHGTLTLGDDGSIEYTPEAGFAGADSFQYVASDGQAQSGVATVTVNVSIVNELPTAADDAYETHAGEILAVEPSGVLANDADADGDALTAVLVDAPASGTVTLAEDGSFQYTPAEGFTGTDTFTYLASDGAGQSNLATVTVNVLPPQQQTPAEVDVSMTVSATPFGEEIAGNWAGSTFWVNSYVQDLRDVPQGVVGGAIDVAFDTALATPTGRVVYGDAFGAFQQGAGDDAGGLIDEAGAIAPGGAGIDGPAGFVAWEFRIDAPTGEVLFSSDAGEGTATITPANFALVGLGSGVDWAAVQFGSASVNYRLGDFNADGAVNHFDLALWLGHADTAEGEDGYDSQYDLTGDQQVDLADRDVLLSAMFGGVMADEVRAMHAEETLEPGFAAMLDLAWVDDAMPADSPESATDSLFQSETDWS